MAERITDVIAALEAARAELGDDAVLHLRRGSTALNEVLIEATTPDRQLAVWSRRVFSEQLYGSEPTRRAG